MQLKDNVIIITGGGQGLGRALLLHSFQVFKQHGEPYVDLKVLESNLRARQLYESAGMRFVLRDIVSKGWSSLAHNLLPDPLSGR